MKMKKQAVFALLTCVISNTFAADISESFAKCAFTKEDRARLACFDKLRDEVFKQNNATAANSYQTMSLTDLKVDIKRLVGKKATVSASIQSVGGMNFLKSDEMDMTPVLADADKLPRDDRKKLASSCQMLLCRGQFSGVIKQMPMGLGMSLDKVEWR